MADNCIMMRPVIKYNQIGVRGKSKEHSICTILIFQITIQEENVDAWFQI